MASSRRILSSLHGWLGGISAVFIILIAGSGAMLAFVGELFIFQYGDVLKATPPTVRPPMADVTRLIASASKGYEQDFQTVGVLMPASRIEKIETAMVFVMPTGPHASDGLRMLSVDPWSTQYKGDFPLNGAFAHELIDFHHSLLMGAPGIIFVCILCILLILFVISGLYIWWPKHGHVWRKASRLHLRGSVKQIVFSLHGLIGVWSALLIIYFCLTGLALAKPNWFSPLLSAPTYAPPASSGFAEICHEKITPADAERAGKQAFPNKRLSTFFMPNKENGPYMLTYKSVSDGNKIEGDGRIYVHTSCHNKVYVENANVSEISVKLTGMMLSLHAGYSFAKPIGSILVVITGLSLVLLAGTGLVTFFTRTLRRRQNG